MTEHFTFRSEVLQKFNDESLYELFIESFEAMPLAADVNGDYLCMHGGVSPDLHSTKDIDRINRFVEPPLKGFLCDLLWADPLDDKDARKMAFTENSQRECSVKFGLEPVKKLFAKNHYLSIIRAHQVQHDGYKMHRWGGQTAFPSVITVFSAPNYCGEYHNKGAVILIENEKMNIKQYKDVKQPFHLPGDLDLFQWSLPFLVDKISEIITKLTKEQNGSSTPRAEKKAIEAMSFSEVNKKIEKSMTADQEKQEKKRKMMERVRAKVLTIGRMNKMLQTMRDNKEALNEIKQVAPDGKVPVGTVMGGKDGIESTLFKFYQKKQGDTTEGFPLRSRRLSLKTREIHNLAALQEQYEQQEAAKKAHKN